MPAPDDAPRPGPDGAAPRPTATDPRRKWLYVGALVVVIAFILLANKVGGPKATSITFSKFKSEATADDIVSATVNNSNGVITGKLSTASGAKIQYTTSGPVQSNQSLNATLDELAKDG